MNKNTKIILGLGGTIVAGIGTALIIRYVKKRKLQKALAAQNGTSNAVVTYNNSGFVPTNNNVQVTTKPIITTTTTTNKPVSTGQNLLKGSRGEAVKQLQQALNFIGKAGLVVDGVFGAKTEQALQKIAGAKVATPSLLSQLMKKMLRV